ncbi:siderophore-interacting protein [Ancylobacter sp. FA202]|uniref:siderophore-interacting protein n=1 Tax=Ancylobacter sp. FA202 TaxID=1111106 RepID=UPI00036E3DA8|nr:siderophore-interacting protein [Ancylobacter sp. FA202]
MTAFVTTTFLRFKNAERLLAELLTHFAEHATVIRTDSGARLHTSYGTVDIARQQEGLSVGVSSRSAGALAMIKVFIAEHVFQFAHEPVAMVWSGDGADERRLPNFQRLRVLAASSVTPRMRRITFQCEDAAPFVGESHYHARLLIPPQGRAPIWPSLAASGRIIWPEGKDALTSRVYSIRSVEPARNILTMDIVVHGQGGSPGACFAKDAREDAIVGVLGPGGGGRPDAGNLLLLGDETALPTIARMLENLPSTSSADVFIEVEDEGEEQMLVSNARVRINWLHRHGVEPGRSARLEQILREQAAREAEAGRFVWAGCERGQAERLRNILGERSSMRRSSHHIMGFWTRQKAAYEPVEPAQPTSH